MRSAQAAASILDRIGEEAESRWGVGSASARRAFVVPIVLGPCLVLLRYVSFPSYMAIVGEDRILEWTQVGLFLAAALLCFRISVRYFGSPGYWMGAAFLAAGVLLVFVAGEEISWGQRLFGWETPAEWRSRNIQGETTIHNDSMLRWIFHTLMMLIGVYGASAPFLYAMSRRTELPEAIVPPMFLSSYFLVVAGGMAVYLSQVFLGDVMIIKFSEYWESCFAIGIVWHLYLIAHGYPFPARERALSTGKAIRSL